MKKILNLIIAGLAVFLIGSLSGYAFGFYRARRENFQEIRWINDINEGIATFNLLEIKNGALKGKMSGRKARLVIDKKNITELQKDSEFEIPLEKIRINDIAETKNIPAGIFFAASKKGKYYYSVFDKRAMELSPKNRIYFKTSAEAEKMGYKKK